MKLRALEETIYGEAVEGNKDGDDGFGKEDSGEEIELPDSECSFGVS